MYMSTYIRYAYISACTYMSRSDLESAFSVITSRIPRN